MNDSEFIELLNLYLDHEISEADAVRLEAEVQSNATRRRIYRNYCQMQKACKMLAADFATDTAVPAPTKAVPFNPLARTSRTGRLYTFGGFAAAAACLAIIFAGRISEQATVTEHTAAPPAALAQATPAMPASLPRSIEPAAEVKVSLVAAESAVIRSARAERPQTRLVADPLFLTGTHRADASLTSSMQEANDQFAWITALQLPPLQQRTSVEHLRFDTAPAVLRPEGGRALGNRSRHAVSPAEEMSAFEFRR